MSRTVSNVITLDEFKALIAYQWSKHEDFWNDVGDWSDEKPVKGMKPMSFLKTSGFCGGRDLTPEVKKDLDKVQFDMENREWEGGEDNSYDGFEKITGFHTLPNGMPYLGCCAGGDWESPLFYLIYFDGKKLRGYIPTDGNTWNTDTKTAYGSEQDVTDTEDAGEKAYTANLKKRFGVDDKNSAEPDDKAIIKDIESRITIVKGYSPKPKGMEDIDWVEIEKAVGKAEVEEKEFEKNQDDRKGACHDSKCSCHTAGAAQAPAVSQPIPMDPDDILEELDRVVVSGGDFLSAVHELRGILEGGTIPVDKVKIARDVKLRDVVARFVKVSMAIENMK